MHRCRCHPLQWVYTYSFSWEATQDSDVPWIPQELLCTHCVHQVTPYLKLLSIPQPYLLRFSWWRYRNRVMKRLWVVRKGKAKLFTHLCLYEDAPKPLTTVLPVVTILQFWIQNLNLDLNSSVPRAHTQISQKHRKTGPSPPKKNYFHNPLKEEPLLLKWQRIQLHFHSDLNDTKHSLL